jgi:hypothetical protein
VSVVMGVSFVVLCGSAAWAMLLATGLQQLQP